MIAGGDKSQPYAEKDKMSKKNKRSIIADKPFVTRTNPSGTTIAAILDALEMSLSEFGVVYDKITERQIFEYKKEIERSRKERDSSKSEKKPASKKKKPHN